MLLSSLAGPAAATPIGGASGGVTSAVAGGLVRPATTITFGEIEVTSVGGNAFFELDNLMVGAPVPEPSTALLLACGLAGLAAAGRRRSPH